jgi:hypothetical protein
MSAQQPEALRLAAELEDTPYDWSCPFAAAAELRRLHARVGELELAFRAWEAAVATPPIVPVQEPVECMCGICKLGKREWVGLTDEVIDRASWDFSEYEGFQHGARWAQDQLREKNGGNK